MDGDPVYGDSALEDTSKAVEQSSPNQKIFKHKT